LLRTSLAATLLSVGMTAKAQNVTIYGIMGLAVEHLTNVNANGDSLKRMPNLTGTLPSRIGFRGSEDLGGGWRALFNLEHGIAADSGGLNNGGRMWGRAAYVGVAGPFGRFTLGRQTTMTVLAVSSHVMGPALTRSPRTTPTSRTRSATTRSPGSGPSVASRPARPTASGATPQRSVDPRRRTARAKPPTAGNAANGARC